MSGSWYDTSFRKLFFDFHSHSAAVGLAGAFDAEAWADQLVAARVQAASVFCKCGFGWSFYQQGSVRYQHPQLPAGLDMLGEQIEAFHRRGLKAIGYYHTFNSEPIARDHPEWLERHADGTARGLSGCLLSPLFDEWMLPHVAEIVSLYDVDSLFFDGTYAHSPCWCEACCRRFAAASGGQAVPSGPKDAAWGEYVAWKLQALREVRQAICETIHGVRDDVVVSINWAYTPRMPEVVPAGIGALVADIMPEDQVYNGSYLSSLWALSERPFDIMNSAFLQWWGDWGCKPAVAMQQEVSAAVARGGLTWIGYQMQQDYTVQPAVMAQLGATLAFVEEREPVLTGAEAVPCVAVLHCTDQHFTRGEPRFFCDERTARGAHRALLESMIPHHLVTAETLLRRLSEFTAVIVPEQRYLSPELVKALSDWVAGGGVLVQVGLSGTLDAAGQETGAFALGELLGVAYEGVCGETHGYLEVTDDRLRPGTLDMPHLFECTFALARPTAAEVVTLARLRRCYLRADGEYLLRWSPVGEDTGCPGITLRPVGRGWAAYVAGDVFRAYQVKNQWQVKPLLANLLNAAIAEPLVRVEAPAWLDVVPMRQRLADGRQRLLIHLVNEHGDRPCDGGFKCVEQILPVRDVTVRVRCGAPAAVSLEPGGATAKCSYADGRLTVSVPQVDIFTTIAITEA